MEHDDIFDFLNSEEYDDDDDNDSIKNNSSCEILFPQFSWYDMNNTKDEDSVWIEVPSSLTEKDQLIQKWQKEEKGDEEKDFVSVSTLKYSEIKENQKLNRILGCIYGQVLGDAIGLATEFGTKSSASKLIPVRKTTAEIPFPNFPRTFHSRHFDNGRWTDDSDQMCLIMRTLSTFCSEHEDIPIRLHKQTYSVLTNSFATEISKWARTGIKELGDTFPHGLGQTTANVIRHSNFLNHTTLVQAEKSLLPSIDNWVSSECNIAPNGAIMRTSIIGCISNIMFTNSAERIEENSYPFYYSPNFFLSKLTPQQQIASLFCLVTHGDPRCLISCSAIVHIIHSLIEREVSFTQEVLHRLIHETTEFAELFGKEFPSRNDNNQFSIERAIEEFHQYSLKFSSIEELQLDQCGSIGYTYKCMAAGFVGLRCRLNPQIPFIQKLTYAQQNQLLFRSALTRLVREAGDADTNGAVLGSVLGTRIGYLSLPQDWLKSLQPGAKKWLDQLVVQFLKSQRII